MGYYLLSINPQIDVVHPAEECPFFPYNIIHIINSTNACATTTCFRWIIEMLKGGFAESVADR